MTTITKEILIKGMSSKGAWSKKQLKLLNVPISKEFKLEKGWKDRLIGSKVSENRVTKFLELKDAHLGKKRWSKKKRRKKKQKKKSQHRKPEPPDEYEVTSSRNSKWYKAWRLLVIHQQGYVCNRCGTNEGKLHVHHKKRYKNNPKERLVLANGEVLCFDCHDIEHGGYLSREYGKPN